jgi:acetyl-CoA carboxylase carboxyl transferase subunit beta
LPKGFQTAEFLQDHGLVDMIVPRLRMREVLAQLLDFLQRKK